jgi:flagellar biosynthesis protein FlhG
MTAMHNRLKLSQDSLAGRPERPTTVSVLSGKGGVGKSVIAYNLASVAAHEGYRCLLLDGDWYFGNLHILANINPQVTLADAVCHGNRTEKAIIKLNEYLCMICSPSAHHGGAEFEARPFARFLADLKKSFAQYDYIITDTPSSDVDIITLTASACDVNLIIVNPELTSIASGYGLFKYLVRSNDKIPVHLFVNRAEDGTEYEYVYQKFAVLSKSFLGRVPYNAGYLLEDKYVIDSVTHQKPLIEIQPESTTAGQFLKLCNLLTEERFDSFSPTNMRAKESINSKTTLADIRE